MKKSFILISLGLLLTSCTNGPTTTTSETTTMSKEEQIYAAINERIENGMSHLNEFTADKYDGVNAEYIPTLNPVTSSSDISYVEGFDPSSVNTDDYYKDINALFPYNDGYRYTPSGSYESLLIPVANKVNDKYEFAFTRLSGAENTSLGSHPFIFHTSIIGYESSYAYWLSPEYQTTNLTDLSGVYETRLNTLNCMMLYLMKNTANFNYDVLVGLDNLNGIFLLPKDSGITKTNFDKNNLDYMIVDFNRF